MAGPIYPTDRPDVSTLDITLSINNITDHREPKLQVATASIDVSGDICTVAKVNAVKQGDPIVFTSVGNVAADLTAGTTYFAHTITGTTTTVFKLATSAANAVAGTAIDLDGNGSTDETAAKFYIADGELTGGELVGVTDTLVDLADTSLDTIPASSAVAGNSVLAELMNEMTGFYDALNPSRVPVTATAASGVFTKAAHGITDGTAITFASNGDTTVSETAGTYTVNVLTANTFGLVVVATGLAYTSSETGTVTYYLPLSAAEKNYLANLKSLKLYYVQDAALKLAFELKRLNAEISNIADTGALPDGMYPSGDQTWNY